MAAAIALAVVVVAVPATRSSSRPTRRPAPPPPDAPPLLPEVVDPPAVASQRRRVAGVGGVLGAAVLALTLLLVAGSVAGIASGRWRVLPILSSSMEPALPAGAAALAVREPVSSLKPGDVIVYNIPIGDRHLQAHRVQTILQGGAHPVIRTKGDANAKSDPWTARIDDDSVWKVRADVPFAGYAIVLAHRPWVRLALIFLTIGVLLVAVLRALWRADVAAREPALA